MEEFPGRVGLRRSFVRSRVVFAAALSPVGAGGQRRPAPPSWGRRRSRCGACQNFHRLRVERDDADERRGRRRPRLEHRRPLTLPPPLAELRPARSRAFVRGHGRERHRGPCSVQVRAASPGPRPGARGAPGPVPLASLPPPSPAPGLAAPAEGRGGPLARADETDTAASTGGGRTGTRGAPRPRALPSAPPTGRRRRRRRRRGGPRPAIAALERLRGRYRVPGRSGPRPRRSLGIPRLRRGR